MKSGAIRIGILQMLLLLSCAMVMSMSLRPAFAQVASNVAPIQFADAAEEQRFHALVSELRCVMCQNQSLADSNAQIARDLRVEVLELMRSGKDDAQIKQFLVQRYGEFVLYKPPMQPRNWLLWFGPLLLLLAGGIALVMIVRRRAQALPAAATAATTDESQEW